MEIIIFAVVIFLTFAPMWFVFSKAGKPGWASVVPIYNIIVLLNIAGKPWWWIILLLIPMVNFIVYLVFLFDLSKAFGYGILFMLVLLFVAPVGFLWLGFGPAKYVG